MFSRLFATRLKSAELALREGRLEEAFRLATSPDLAGHRRAAAVRADLAARLLERARQHFRSDRFSEALTDLDMAAAGNVHQEEIAELREHILTVAGEARRQEASRRQRLDAARRRVESGSLAAGRNILEGSLHQDPEARRIKASIERRDAEAAVIAGQAEIRLDEGQWAAAIERFQAARRLDAHDPAVARLERRICDSVLGQVRECIREGRLNRGSELLSLLVPTGIRNAELNEHREFLDLAAQAATQAQGGRFGEAHRLCVRLSRMVEGLGWLDRAMALLETADRTDTELRAGPFGQTWGSMPAAAGRAEARLAAARVPGGIRMDETLDVGSAQNGSHEPLLLLVDGAGSYLLLRSDRVSIGRAASAQPADIALQSDLAERHADLARMGEDYFLYASRDMEISGRRCRQNLLRNGDRVMLGRRAKFEFLLPSRRSLTAVLRLSATTRMPNDVRSVVLFREHATIANSSTAHIVCRSAAEPAVLFDRQGQLWARVRDSRDEPIRVEPGVPMEVGGVSFVVQPWQVRRSSFA